MDNRLTARARLLGRLLIPVNADYSILLRRAPDVKLACRNEPAATSVASVRELLGITSAREWRRKGVEIATLGEPPHNGVHPHDGVFSPVRGECIHLVATAHFPKPPSGQALIAFDVGTGTGHRCAVRRAGAARGVRWVQAS